MTAHEHRLGRRRLPDGRPSVYCLVIGCWLALAAPPGMPDYRRAGMRHWA